MRRGRRRYDPAGLRESSDGARRVRKAGLQSFFCGGGGFQWTRRMALRLPFFRMIPKSAVAVFGSDHAQK